MSEEKAKIPAIRFKGFTDAWEQRKLGDMADIRRGLTYSPTDISNTGVRVLRSSNINGDKFVLGDKDVFVNPEAVTIEEAREGDILITAANGSTNLVGKHAIIDKMTNETMVHGGFMLLARTQNPSFVNSLLGTSWYRKSLFLTVAGGNGTIGNLKKNDLDNQKIRVPSELERASLGTGANCFDNLITLHQRLLFC